MSLQADLASRKRHFLSLLQGLPVPQRARTAIGAAGYDVGRAALAPPTAHQPIGEVGGEGVLVRWVQAALTVLMGARLPLDGRLGQQTRVLLLQFQKQAGLATHGRLDAATLRALERAVGVAAPAGRGYGTRRSTWQDGRPLAPRPAPPDDTRRPDAVTTNKESAS